MEAPPPAKAAQISSSSPLVSALISRDMALIKSLISSQVGVDLNAVDENHLSPALIAMYFFHDARQCLGLHVSAQVPLIVKRSADEPAVPMDAEAVRTQFGYTPIDALEFDSIELLRKALCAKKLQILARVVTTGDLSSEPWLEYQLHLAKKFGADIEKRNQADVYVAHVSKEVGWGVFAAQPIAKGAFVGEYLGVVRRAQALGGEYACSYADILPYCKLSVDSAQRGNWTRFVNHSSTRANLGWRDVFANGLSHVIFVAQVPIAAHEQLLVDYGSEYWTSVSQAPVEL